MEKSWNIPAVTPRNETWKSRKRGVKLLARWPYLHLEFDNRHARHASYTGYACWSTALLATTRITLSEDLWRRMAEAAYLAMNDNLS